MVAATPGFVPGPSDPLTVKTYDLFFAAIRLFLEHGVTHVAEAAFQHENWARGLEPLLPLATVLDCPLPGPGCDCAFQSPTTVRDQPSRAAHDDTGHFSMERPFDPIRLDAPTLDVDTTNGYRPNLDAIAAFIRM